MTLDLIVILISVTVVGGLGFALRCDWGARMGQNLGKKHMEEIGMDNDNKEYRE
ncbi:MAG: hypothetical protein HDR17_07905 [Lachnospiraceae bacterium]|nr:hypothetical protein [Lachnospiraceae bacterium]